MKRGWMWKIGKGILFLVGGIFVFGWVVMSLWNAIIPGVFHGPVLTFWQAVGLLVLSHLLLRGWAPWRYGNGWRRDRWRRRFEEKLAAMTPKEREKFKEEWRRRCGPHSGKSEEKKQV